jgi:Protein of unknown function (DUF3141)
VFPTNGVSTKVNDVTAKTGGVSGRTPQVGLPLVRRLGLAPASGLVGQAWDYWFDRAQRTVLLLDVKVRTADLRVGDDLRRRAFDRPANHALLKVKPRAQQQIDPEKRPYIIVDPRAGHGPGVGGFKEDSQIGMAMRAGHACYLVTFFPEPVKGQTIADVHHDETIFVHHVRTLHADANKPVVIGNC